MPSVQQAASDEAQPTHYNDWPNTQGFDVRYQELEPTELEIVGTIPAFCAGVLFRNGLGPREIETNKNGVYKVSHWFDNLSQVHRFQIHAPTAEHPQVRVTHNSRLTCDGLIKRVKKTGYLGEVTFGAKYDLCMSLFQKAQSLFRTVPEQIPDNMDINVTLSVNYPGISSKGTKSEQPIEKPGIRTLCNKSDNTWFQMLDPSTLEPIGVADQKVLHPSLKGPLSASHPEVDPVTGDVYNYNLDMGHLGAWRVFHVSASTGKTSILETIRHRPAYIHSLFLTENYVVLCVWGSPFRVGGLPLLYTHNFIDSLADYDRTNKTTWFVVDRKPGGRGLVATYKSENFFSFHSINAYEEPSVTDPTKVDIVADLTTYENLDVLKRLYIDNLLSDSPAAKKYTETLRTDTGTRLCRFRLPQVPTTSNGKKPLIVSKEFSHMDGMWPELTSINSRFKLHKHRYVYGVVGTGHSTFFDGLFKFDMETKEYILWQEQAQTASEPIFVADPSSDDEEAGVLLSVVLDGAAGKSYLLVLDPKTMTEIARANVNSPVGFGFHGAYFADI